MEKKCILGVKNEVKSKILAIENNEFTFKDKGLTDYKDLYYLHLKNNVAIYSQDNKVDIYTDGKDKFTALVNDLEDAQDHIHLLYYIIRNDELGNNVADVLIKKAQEGVEVRLVYDDMGSR